MAIRQIVYYPFKMRIKIILKWLLVGLGGVVGIVLLGVAIVYVLIEIDLGRTFDEIDGMIVEVAVDDASIAEGQRLAQLRGCFGGCHGKAVNGQIFFEVPDGTRVIAPDLTRIVNEYSIEEIERVIRHGIRPDGTSVFLVMPSTMFYNLSDSDLGKIVAFLKSQSTDDVQLPTTWLGPVGRSFLFYYKQLVGTILAAELIDHDAKRIEPLNSDGSANGHYLAMTICTECHNDDLRGSPDGWAPTLAIVAAYSPQKFRTLMREGTPLDDRDLDVMDDVAVKRFSQFTDPEIDSLHAYLSTLAATAPDP